MPNSYYGIGKNVFYKIINIFKLYSDIIEKVTIFGSRARGDYKEYSDIDIAIKFKKDNNKIYEIIGKIENENIIYTFDILDYEKIKNEKIKEYIHNEGKIIFLSNEEGELLMNINKITDKIEDLKKAAKKLKECVVRDYKQDDIIIDATIQRFEFTYELSWKLMKAYLEYNGNNEATSPRKSIKEAFKSRLITNGELWLEMLEDRNRTAHTYNEESALEIFENIKNKYVDLIDEFIKKIDSDISE